MRSAASPWRQVGGKSLAASLVHRGELAPVQIEHARREAALARDPRTHVLRIDVHQELRAAAAGDRAAVLARMPGGVEAEPRAAGHANPIARDHAEDHGAGRQAGPVDDDALTRAAQLNEVLEIWSDLAACIADNSNRCGSRRQRERRNDGAENDRTKSHGCSPPCRDPAEYFLREDRGSAKVP